MTMIMKLTKAMVLGGAVALVAITGGVGEAEAGKRGGFFKHKSIHFSIHRIHRPRFVVHSGYSNGGGCGFYKFKWKKTGSFFWKSKYFDCKGY
ncbi:MAG: hypothetical protein NW217_09455 [Hyphomicrobiaceae bacterium]|nr:hypothetical protein [Hyphomicrobiaceae bacterium]